VCYLGVQDAFSDDNGGGHMKDLTRQDECWLEDRDEQRKLLEEFDHWEQEQERTRVTKLYLEESGKQEQAPKRTSDQRHPAMRLVEESMLKVKHRGEEGEKGMG
jgi:hypothetical protein